MTVLNIYQTGICSCLYNPRTADFMSSVDLFDRKKQSKKCNMYSISTLINTSNGNVPKRMHMLTDTCNGQRFCLTIINPSIHFLTRIWKQVIKANWWILMHPQVAQVIFCPACPYSASHSCQSWTCAKHLNPKTCRRYPNHPNQLQQFCPISKGEHRHPLQRVYPQSYSFHQNPQFIATDTQFDSVDFTTIDQNNICTSGDSVPVLKLLALIFGIVCLFL